MSYFDGVNVTEIQKGGLSVLMTATLLTICEILFFYKSVVPTVRSQVTEQLSEVGKFNDEMYDSLKSIFHNLDMKEKTTLNYILRQIKTKTGIDMDVDVLEMLFLSSFDNNEIKNVFSNSKDDLEIFIDKFIKENVLTSVLDILYLREDTLVKKINNYTYLVAFLIIITLVCSTYGVYNSLCHKIPVDKISSDMKEVYISTAITLFCLICFQIVFYKFGLSYKYIGSKGGEEFMKFIFVNIQSLSK